MQAISSMSPFSPRIRPIQFQRVVLEYALPKGGQALPSAIFFVRKGMGVNRRSYQHPIATEEE